MVDRNVDLHYAIYLDTSKCTGCKGCQVACKCWNQLPSPLGKNANPSTGSYQAPADLNGDTRLIVTFNEGYDKMRWGVEWSIGRRSCMHCINPACVSVCSSGALSVDSATGFVVVDESKCVSCEYCSSACPFNVPRYRGKKGKISKCNACIDRLSNGKAPSINDGTGQTEMQFNQPACVHTCPAGALQFGLRGALFKTARQRVDWLKNREINPAPNACIYGETELDGLHVIMVLKYEVASYNLPIDPHVNPIIDLLNYMRPVTGLAAAATVLGLGISFFTGLGYKRGKLHYDAEKHETIDVETGEVLWKQEYPAAVKVAGAKAAGGGGKADANAKDAALHAKAASDPAGDGSGGDADDVEPAASNTGDLLDELLGPDTDAASELAFKPAHVDKHNRNVRLSRAKAKENKAKAKAAHAKHFDDPDADVDVDKDEVEDAPSVTDDKGRKSNDDKAGE